MSNPIGLETPVPILINSLARGGWGELSGRQWGGLRAVLQAIAALTKYNTGIDVTIHQISLSASLTEKWTARCLYILEGLGLIRWQRGRIINGEPKPGFIAVIKTVLLDLVFQAWHKNRAEWRARSQETRQRLTLLKKNTLKNTRSPHTELSSSLKPTFQYEKLAYIPTTPTPTGHTPAHAPAPSAGLGSGFGSGTGSTPTPAPATGSGSGLVRPGRKPRPNPSGTIYCLICKKTHRPLNDYDAIQHIKTHYPPGYDFALRLYEIIHHTPYPNQPTTQNN